MGRRSRFLGRQCRPCRHLRLHGGRVELGRRRSLAALARRRGGPRHAGLGGSSSTGGSCATRIDGGSLFTSVSAEPERPLARMLDAASRRDFIYLVVLLALFGKSNWFRASGGAGRADLLLPRRVSGGARAARQPMRGEPRAARGA